MSASTALSRGRRPTLADADPHEPGYRRWLGEVLPIGTVLLACLPLLWPLFGPGMPATHDGFLHVQRLIALDAAARDGAPFSRWLPDLAYGYGQPLLLYYAPLSYLPALLFRLGGAGFIASFTLTSGLALVLSALSMYGLARSLVGRLSAVTAAVVYAALPYQMVDVYVRGAIAETWAFVWLPLGALCLIRLWISGNWRWAAGASAALGGLIATHNVTALLYLPALVALVIAAQVARRRADFRFAAQATAALALGVGLAAWFWLPALAERGLVQIEQTIEPKLFASFFLSQWPPFRLDPIFDYQQPVSEALGYPIFWPQLGLVQALVSLAGGVALVRTRGLPRAVGVWALLLVVGGLLFQTRPFAIIYDLIPLLAFVQFPWRLLALVGLGSALLAGFLVESRRQPLLIRLTVAGVVVVASVTTAVLRLQPEQTIVDERLLSTETIVRAELAEYGLGSTHSGEYLPVSSGQRNAARFRKTILDAGGPRTPLAPIALTVERVDWRPGQIVVDVTSASTTEERLLFSQFAFDGWGMKVDGLTVRALAVGQAGVSGVTIMPGQHTVELTWTGTRTSARQLGISLSAASLAILVFLLASGRLRWRTRLIAGASVALVVAGGSSGWTVPTLPTASPAAAETSRWQTVDDTLALTDTRLDTSRMAADRLLTARLIWLVRAAPSTGYRAFVEATAVNGTIHRAPWVYEPLSRLWERGQLTATTVAVRLPPTFPTGPADLRVVFDQPAGLEPIPLGRVDVPPTPAALPATQELQAAELFSGGVGLAFARGQTVSARPGVPVDVSIQWAGPTTAADVRRELLVRAVLVGTDGRPVPISEARRPGDWFAPLPFWQAGDRIEQRLRLTVPPSVSTGTYPYRLEVFGRELARGGAAEPGAGDAKISGLPLATVDIGMLTVEP